MFLFMKNNRLRSFFRHLNTIPQTKVLDTHPCQTYAASNMMLHPMPHHPDCKYPEVYYPVPSVVFKRDECTSAVLCIGHTLGSHCTEHRIHNWMLSWKSMEDVIDACQQYQSQLGFYMEHPHNAAPLSAWPQASQLRCPTFLAITDVLAK